ncbi:hydroxymethylbilane synthase [Desulfosarcina sp. OttesenSCG-928-A07]|nr:hydroxymethylbilane synthase [Desulfosarcina sp. OttesenSCG-928-G17]MDL2330156.1 hydroxymethylbilane synthase [Desulfosarcina sp. OttesenSCG-928-A07]
MTAATTIVIGTRGSPLALWQAGWAKDAILEGHPELCVSLRVIKTQGDKILDVPLAQVGGKGLFVKEIETALLDGHIDLAVHSMKDMPAEIPAGLCIGAIPEREIPWDALISRSGHSLKDLPPRARIGTSSLRRAAQLRHIRPDMEIVPLRGNLDTRLKKLETESLDATILAAAGLRRLKMEDRVTQILDETVMLPAVGQGALCIEIRQNDPRVEAIVRPLDHLPTRQAVLGERAFLKRLEGGCQVPIAGHGKIHGDGTFSITGLVCDLKGQSWLKKTRTSAPDQSEAAGLALAETLLALGAGEILERL